MKPTTTTPIRFVRRARWPAIAVMSTGALVAAHFVVAAPPPAGTSIGNQASATYYDGTATRTAQSTMVTTTVTQVGGFALDPNGAKTGAAGATLYVPHIITNSGNGTDNFTIKVAETAGNPDFTKIEVYPDANGDGLPDAGAALCSITTAGSDCLTTAQPATGNGGQFRFVIAYTIPPTATVGTWAATNSSTVTVESTNAGIYTGSHIQTLTDTITLTTGAALNVTKAITAPSASRPSGTWPVNTSGLRGAETTYTLTYSNSGGAAAPLYIEDTLPAGLAYVAGSAVWSGASGQALTDAAGSETVAGIDFEESAGVIKAVVANVPQGVTGTLSFVVTASPTAALGTSTTTNIAKYSATGCAAATNVATATCTGSLTDTGSSAFTVLQSFGTVFGISSTAPVVDTTPGTPATSGDRFDLASATAGSTHKFDLYVQNTGNGADVFDLTSPTVGGVGEFPAGTTFTWLTAGGVALLDSNGNGVQDTGSVAAGAIHHVVLQATLPLGLALNPAADYTAIVRATSGGDTGKFDATSVRIVAIVGSGLDLSHTNLAGDADLGPGPGSTASVTQTASAGDAASFAIYPLIIQNNGSSALANVTLAASQTSTFPGSLPSGVTVTYSTSATCAAGNDASSPLASIAAGGSATVYACVQASNAVSAGTYQLYFRANDATAVVSDTIHDALTVVLPNTYRFTATPSNSGQAAPGGSIVFSHTVANTGSMSCGASNFSVTTTNVTAGWTTALYVDVNNDGVVDAGDTLIDNTTTFLGTLAGGASAKILVKMFVPGGATDGSTGSATVVVREVAAPGPTVCVIQGADPVNTVTVQTAQVTVAKTQALDAACANPGSPAFGGASFGVKPGECVIYKVVATNSGAADVTNVSVEDSIPSYTAYVAGSGTCTSSGVTGTAVALTETGSPVTSLSCGSAANTVAGSGVGAVTLTFSVKVNQ